MAVTVRLQDIVDILEMQFDESPSFLDLDTGEVRTVSRELLNEAEQIADDEDLDIPQWQEEEWQTARRIVSSGNFRNLPTKFDVHEWEIMRDFSLSVESDRIREELFGAIQGPGAFRYFKDTIRRYRIEQAWYKFRTESLRQIAIQWCEKYQVPWA